MKALVTGASGFIGSTLIEELNTLGFEVHALMRRTSSPANLEGLSYKKVEGDLCDVDSLKRAVSGVDYVFHLAGMTAAPNREAFFEHNCHGTRRLAEAVAQARPGLSRMVFVSSLAAGGPANSADSPVTERDPSQPVSAYGESKLQAEQELLKFKDQFPISILRPPIVYGPKDKAFFVVIQTIARNLMPILRGSNKEGQKYYSAIHCKDLVRGIVQAGVAPADRVPSGEIFYLSADGHHSYQEMLTTIADRLECDPLKIKVPKSVLKLAAVAASAAGWVTRRNFPFNLDKLNEFLPDYWVCSNDKAKELLGFKPEYDLQSGMAHTIDWYRRQKWL